MISTLAYEIEKTNTLNSFVLVQRLLTPETRLYQRMKFRETGGSIDRASLCSTYKEHTNAMKTDPFCRYVTERNSSDLDWSIIAMDTSPCY